MKISGAAVVILNEKNELLVLKRPDSVTWAPNKWGLPGGKIEPGETPRQAAIRETKEETTLIVSNLKKIKLSLDNPVAAYYTRDYSGDVKIDFEHTDWAWIAREEVEKYDLAPDTLGLYEWVLNND